MLIDAHAHLNGYDLLGPGALDAALAEIEHHRIFTISNSMDLPSYRRNLEIAGACGLVLPVFGIHPWYAPDYVDRLSELRAPIEQSPILGEIGLDHHFVEDKAAHEAQERVLEFFFKAAAEQDKIVILHTKGAERDILALLNRHHVRRMIVHWYSGPLKILRELEERGAYFTIGIEAAYSRRVQDIVLAIPPDRLLTETDNPGGPKEFIEQPGSPALLRDVVRKIAEIRQTSEEAVLHVVRANLLMLMRGDPRLADAVRVIRAAHAA
ncbi:MAG: TatD family hydrolase [Candidatus Aminicenantes bacterium]|nr:TatD family hydrolase [Candidatus Aminicenantes bacterium]